jgi:hypothetical protein
MTYFYKIKRISTDTYSSRSYGFNKIGASWEEFEFGNLKGHITRHLSYGSTTTFKSVPIDDIAIVKVEYKETESTPLTHHLKEKQKKEKEKEDRKKLRQMKKLAKEMGVPLSSIVKEKTTINL